MIKFGLSVGKTLWSSLSFLVFALQTKNLYIFLRRFELSFKNKYSTCSHYFCFFVLNFLQYYLYLCMSLHFRTFIVCSPKRVTPFQIFVRCYCYWGFLSHNHLVFQFFQIKIQAKYQNLCYFINKETFFLMRNTHVCPSFWFKRYVCFSLPVKNYARIE